jgi:shikimate dehydrogenase
MLSGATRLYAIVGDPVAQTRSPIGLTEEFAARGVDAICIPIHASAADFDTVIRALKRIRNLDGMLITVPHKPAAVPHCDRPSARATALGALNALRREADGAWTGDMTDGDGMLAALAAGGISARGKHALLVGAGGAGSACALALVENGVTDLVIADVDPARVAALIARIDHAAAGRVRAGPADPRGADLIVNATPAGMRASEAPPIDPDLLVKGSVMVDLITAPTETALVTAARQRGCIPVTGDDVFASSRKLLADFMLAGRD